MKFYYALEQVMGYDKVYTDSNVIMCKENNTLVFKDKNTTFYCARQSIMNFDVEATWYEYHKQIELTDDEKVILRNVDGKFEWITRDSDGVLCLFKSRPNKKMYTWMGGIDYKNIGVFNHLFQNIQWEDSEPRLIADLIKE